MFGKLRALGSFKGRANRARYWALAILTGLTGRLLEWFSLRLGQGESLFDLIVALLLFLLFWGLVWLFVATAVRRLHDTGRSGKWALLYVGVPALGGIFLPDGQGGSLTARFGVPVTLTILLVALVIFGITLWGLRVLGVSKGTAGPNRYGPDPLAEAAAPSGG